MIGDDEHALEYGPDYKYALQKAYADPFTYELMLSTGLAITFEQADHLPDGWVHLREPKTAEGREFKRGLDVRLEHIVYVADCPMGS